MENTHTLDPTPVDTPQMFNSAVSWGAIVAGAAAAASLSLILLILGVGLGLSSVSPWSHEGVSATAFGVSTIVWLTLTQLLASGLGGYLAGRLRTRWAAVHRDEVFFRDTAHGFLSWAVASLVTAALLTSAIGSILGGGVQAASSVVGGLAGTATSAVGAMGGVAAASSKTQPADAGTGGTGGLGGLGGVMGYWVDSLFRRDAATAASSGAVAATAPGGSDTNERSAARDTAEVSRIFMNISATQPLPAEDLRYVGQLVAQRTGLSQADAEKRVAAVYAKAQAKLQDAQVAAQDAADKARKASAYSALWLFVSLLVGAFVASLAATFGGRLRDA